VLGVLNSVLEGKEYLVGNKVTIADLSFITWDATIPFILTDAKLDEEFPHWSAWHKRLTARPAVAKILAEKAAASKH
jgi:glutathione S-transferase